MSGGSRGAQRRRAGARCPSHDHPVRSQPVPVRAPFRCAFVGHHTQDIRTCVRIGRYSQWAAGRWRDARADFGKHRPAASFPQETRRREPKNLRYPAPRTDPHPPRYGHCRPRTGRKWFVSGTGMPRTTASYRTDGWLEALRRSALSFDNLLSYKIRPLLHCDTLTHAIGLLSRRVLRVRSARTSYTPFCAYSSACSSTSSIALASASGG